MENSNDSQKSALETLRENIKKNQEAKENIINFALDEFKKVLLEVPEVKEPSGEAEFDLERYQQLTRKVDAVYNNYLVSKQEFIQASDKMAEQLKLLAKTMNETLHEGTKPRF